MTEKKSEHILIIQTLLQEAGILKDDDEWSYSRLTGDGSERSFFRIVLANNNSYIGVVPVPGDGDKNKKKLAEAQASYNIGIIIVFEDLGDTLLHNILPGSPTEDVLSWAEAKDIYMEIIEILLFMQISGSVRFNRKWCWDTPRYDKKVMLEKESGYFRKSFCRNLLGITNFADGLNDELKLLANRAGRQPAVYFLHRDFQSRNIMIADEKIRIIDFQGGRLGPLGYDLVSLLIDPYAALPGDLQQELLEHYIFHLWKYGLDDLAFLKGLPSLAFQRNLQILGAFAFLSQQKEKIFFKQYLKPAALSLHQRLATKDGEDYPCLQALTEQSLNLLEKLETNP
jgi:aminoglycoside/choline kinase family phosphotransferase